MSKNTTKAKNKTNLTNSDIDDVLNSVSENNSVSEYSADINSNNVRNNDDIADSENSALDINADTETMNDQLDRHMAKQNKQNKNSDSDTPKKICQIDKNMLKTLIIEWLSLDDQIKSYNEVVKDLKEEKKQFESQILELMGTLKQEVILTDKGNLTRTVKESKEPLTPDLIKATLSEILKCTQTADTYTNQIMEKRKVKETVNLKRKDVDGKKGKGKGAGKGPKQADGEKKKRGGKKKNNDNDDALDV